MSNSARSQSNLSEFASPSGGSDGSEDDHPKWEPDSKATFSGGAQKTCPDCGQAISADFCRVFGNNDDELENGCYHCATLRDRSGKTGFGSAQNVI